MTTLKESLRCLALACVSFALVAFGVLCIGTLFVEQRAAHQIHAEASDTRTAIFKRLDEWESHVNVRIGEGLKQISDTRKEAAGQITALRADLFGQDGRSGAVGAIRGDSVIAVNQQGSAMNATLALALNGDHGLVPAARDFMADYRVLPAMWATEVDQLNAAVRPSFLSIEPEITCRHADGTGYGGCWHSAITGLMNESKKTLGQVTIASKQFPGIATDFHGLTSDAHTFTSKAVAPCTGWCVFRAIFATGGGVVRAAGAAGAF